VDERNSEWILARQESILGGCSFRRMFVSEEQQRTVRRSYGLSFGRSFAWKVGMVFYLFLCFLDGLGFTDVITPWRSVGAVC
jgi:hypothetical protein